MIWIYIGNGPSVLLVKDHCTQHFKNTPPTYYFKLDQRFKSQGPVKTIKKHGRELKTKIILKS